MRLNGSWNMNWLEVTGSGLPRICCSPQIHIPIMMLSPVAPINSAQTPTKEGNVVPALEFHERSGFLQTSMRNSTNS